MTDAPEPQKPRRWWLRMLVASAALVAVLLGAVWLTPVVRLHYHAWQYRKGGDLVHLKAAARILRDRKAHIDTVERLLEPESDAQRYVSRTVDDEHLFYEGKPKASAGEMSVGPTIELRFDKEKRLATIYYESVDVETGETEWVEMK